MDYLLSQPQGLQQLAEKARLSGILIPSHGDGQAFSVIICGGKSSTVGSTLGAPCFADGDK